MERRICICESAYAKALTRGKCYTILDEDIEKGKVRIKGDNDRARWYPSLCFSSDDCPVPVLVGYELDDPIVPGQDSCIDVTVQLSNGEKRWCSFATPAVFLCGQWIDGTEIPFHYCNRNLIIAGELSEDLIGRMLREIDRQGELAECTLPLHGNGET